ncbi:MAG TPA: HipA domain-containing protein [Acidimicrobiales bacterium]|nr:HipA domain-containing protein [Acidimicrobiales bacterium]
MPGDVLNIWIDGRVVATLQRARSDIRLQYEPDEQQRSGDGSIVLSTSLPVRSQPYDGDVVGYWLEGVLPEGEARTVLESLYDVRRGDAFGLLRRIGRECAGAVAFLPEGREPAPPGRPKPITDDELAEAITNLPAHPLGDTAESGISLGGLQSKLLVCKTPDGWALPANGAPSTHIMKPAPAQHLGLARAEAYAMNLAAAAGLSAAAVDLLVVDGRDVLVVERFDRELVDGVTRRLHQEDACQALGRDPRDRRKYQQATGGPSYGAIAKLLSAHAVDVDRELRALTEAMTFTCAIGNTDAHGKNHGFLIADGTLSLAPIYDAAPTESFVAGRNLAMYVGAQTRIDRVNRIQLALEAHSWGLPKSSVTDLIDETLNRIRDALGNVATDDVPREVVEDVAQYHQRLAESRVLQRG